MIKIDKKKKIPKWNQLDQKIDCNHSKILPKIDYNQPQKSICSKKIDNN